MRVAGVPWREIAAKVHRQEKTCRCWPSKFKDRWDTLYREAQRKRFDDTDNLVHTRLREHLNNEDLKIQERAISLWMKTRSEVFKAPDPNQPPPPAKTMATWEDSNQKRIK